MAKPKRHDQAKPARTGSKRLRISDLLTPKAFVIGVFLVAGAILAPSWFGSGGGDEAAFLKLAEQGRPALARVKTIAEVRGAHIAPGTKVVYGSKFPTSGPHWQTPAAAGYYTGPQVTQMLVHSLEHGFIIIYYDKLDANARATLQEWAKMFTNPRGGVIVMPMPGLGKSVVLTAWNRRLKLDSFAAKDAAAFVDAFRGRGPEGRIR